jgi:HSP20 family protein
MREDMDKLFESMAMPSIIAPIETMRAFPAVDVFERDNQIVVKVEVPGLKKDDIEVTATEDSISLKGEFKREEETREEGYCRREMRSGRFFRTIPMPSAVKPDDVKASFHDGILEITAPKAEQAQAREKKIEIQG